MRSLIILYGIFREIILIGEQERKKVQIKERRKSYNRKCSINI